MEKRTKHAEGTGPVHVVYSHLGLLRRGKRIRGASVYEDHALPMRAARIPQEAAT